MSEWQDLGIKAHFAGLPMQADGPGLGVLNAGCVSYTSPKRDMTNIWHDSTA